MMSSTKFPSSLVTGAAVFAFMSAVPLTVETAAEYPSKPMDAANRRKSGYPESCGRNPF